MIDRIPSSRIAAPGVGDARAPRAAASAVPLRETGAASPATHALSSEPRRIAAEGPPIDAGRVDRLRASLADGSYVVDAERIAAAMIAAERGL